MTLAIYACALLTAISAVVSLGFPLGGLGKVAGTAAVGSRYACARSLALAVIAVGAVFTGSIAFVAAAAAMTVVQTADGRRSDRGRNQGSDEDVGPGEPRSDERARGQGLSSPC
jgi:hypothetical protein